MNNFLQQSVINWGLHSSPLLMNTRSTIWKLSTSLPDIPLVQHIAINWCETTRDFNKAVSLLVKKANGWSHLAGGRIQQRSVLLKRTQKSHWSSYRVRSGEGKSELHTSAAMFWQKLCPHHRNWIKVFIKILGQLEEKTLKMQMHIIMYLHFEHFLLIASLFCIICIVVARVNQRHGPSDALSPPVGRCRHEGVGGGGASLPPVPHVHPLQPLSVLPGAHLLRTPRCTQGQSLHRWVSYTHISTIIY